VFGDPGLTKNPATPRVETLIMRIHNTGEGELNIGRWIDQNGDTQYDAPSIHLLSTPTKAECTFGMYTPSAAAELFGVENTSFAPGSVCPLGMEGKSCWCIDPTGGNNPNCDPQRASTKDAEIVLGPGAYVQYVLTYQYDGMHEGCTSSMQIMNDDEDTELLAGAEQKENPWTLTLVGSQSCSIDIIPEGETEPGPYHFGSGVIGLTKGTTLGMKLSEGCEVRLLGMRVVDAATADPQSDKRGGLASLCVTPNDTTAEPEPTNAACATNNCFLGGAGVARCIDTCAADADCGNGMKCQDDGTGSGVYRALLDGRYREVSPRLRLAKEFKRRGGSSIIVYEYVLLDG